MARLLLFPSGDRYFHTPKDTNMQKMPKVLLLAVCTGLAMAVGIARAEDKPADAAAAPAAPT
ncbi:MAG TPA: hypothetical protein VF386_09790, partial [Usitatibacter sp.]